MTGVVIEQQDPTLSVDLLAHLATQLDSAKRMLGIVLEQGVAIRQRAVPTVVRMAGALQVEIHRRELIERERHQLLERAGLVFGVGADKVTMTMLTASMDQPSSQVARERQHELREMLRRIQREHTVNRALMRQELTFLDHLLRLAGGGGGYDAAGAKTSARKTARLMRLPALDMEA